MPHCMNVVPSFSTCLVETDLGHTTNRHSPRLTVVEGRLDHVSLGVGDPADERAEALLARYPISAVVYRSGPGRLLRLMAPLVSLVIVIVIVIVTPNN
jgi:hypothetical protein